MTDHVREACARLVVGYPLGALPGGAIIGSLIGLLYIIIFHVLVQTHPIYILTSTIILIAACMLITSQALAHTPPPLQHSCILNKICGIIVSFLFLPIWMKLLLFGFLLFHILSFYQQALLSNGFLYRFWFYDGVIGLFSRDLTIGFCINLLLRSMLWVMQ